MSALALIADPMLECYHGTTGIFVRAKKDGKYASVDIAELEPDSFTAFLRSRGGDNEWAESTARILLDVIKGLI